jgi:hypothetical protein
VWIWITLIVTSIRAVRTLHHAPTHTRSTLLHTPTHTHSRTRSPTVMLKLLVNLLIVSSRSNIHIEGMTSFPLNLPLAYSRWSFTFSKQYLSGRHGRLPRRTVSSHPFVDLICISSVCQPGMWGGYGRLPSRTVPSLHHAPVSSFASLLYLRHSEYRVGMDLTQ